MLRKFRKLLDKLDITYSLGSQIRILERSDKIAFLETISPYVIAKRESSLIALHYYKSLEANDPTNIVVSTMQPDMYYTASELADLTGLKQNTIYRVLRKLRKQDFTKTLNRQVGNSRLLHSRGR